MALNITLNPPFIALVPVSASLNSVPIVPVSDNLRFCTVYQINYDTMHVDVGQQVLIDITKARQVEQLTQAYFLADEADVLFTEDVEVAP